ncbi:unnamed protein product [Urochloa decumbens]|uniref:FYVE-type domain-containing protein n=1 Tax=Urochloa decumbens TaxID=240449 RepID=A0ABC9DCH2_9POAL
MGEKATLRLARQELEDLYLGVPDDSVDLTFKDLASSSLPAPATAVVSSKLSPVHEGDGDPDEHKKKKTGGCALSRSSTNIFTYRPLEADRYDAGGGALGAGGGALLQLSPPSPAAPPQKARFVVPHHVDDDDDYVDRYHHAAPTAGTAGEGTAGGRRIRSSHVADDDDAARGGGHRERRGAVHSRGNNYRRPGIPHSNMCALCNNYVYLFRHRCLVCGRVYCRRCVGAGMGDMTEGRKCVDCLGRRYSHRYIHRAGDAAGGCGILCCFWGYYPDAKAVTAQELIWAEKGPAPRRRPPRPAAGMSSASYGGSGYYSSTVNSASISSINMNHSDGSIAMMINGGGHRHASSGGMPASASSSFVAAFPHNPHALPL